MDFQLNSQQTNNKQENEKCIVQIKENEIQTKQMNCDYCKIELTSNYRTLNKKNVCQDCFLIIQRFQSCYTKKFVKKTFSSLYSQFTCKMTMIPTSLSLDFNEGICQICQSYKILLKVCDQDHYFCGQCIQQFIELNYDKNTKCMQDTCLKQLNYQLTFMYLESNQLQKWKPVTEQIECINPICSADWKVWPTYIEGNIEKITFNQCKCKLCQTMFCCRCRSSHQGTLCQKDISFQNYCKNNNCFQCPCCNAISEPSYCSDNNKIESFSEWQYHIYQCYICKRRFCYDCKQETKITLFSKYKCDHCPYVYKKLQQKKRKKSPKEILNLIFAFIVIVIFCLYSMIFIQIPQIFDVFFQKIDPICQTKNAFKIFILIINLPIFIGMMFIIYIITLIPLSIYNAYQTFILKKTYDDLEQI